MREDISQGDILKVENIKMPVLVVSKDFFNQTGEIVGCPIDKNGESGALHIKIETDRISGCVKCEQLKLLDTSRAAS